MTGETFQEALGRRLEDWQREDLAMEVQRNVAPELLGEILQDLCERVSSLGWLERNTDRQTENRSLAGAINGVRSVAAAAAAESVSLH